MLYEHVAYSGVHRAVQALTLPMGLTRWHNPCVALYASCAYIRRQSYARRTLTCLVLSPDTVKIPQGAAMPSKDES